MIDVLPCSREEWEKYLREYWWPAINRDSTQYRYWRASPQVRMGRFRIVRSEGQEVIAE